jgi:hypothetical protein
MRDDLEYEPDVFAPKRQLPERDNMIAAFENELRQFIKRDDLSAETGYVPKSIQLPTMPWKASIESFRICRMFATCCFVNASAWSVK